MLAQEKRVLSRFSLRTKYEVKYQVVYGSYEVPQRRTRESNFEMMCVACHCSASAVTAPRYFLARHGQTNFNKEGRIQGTLDTSVLTLDGIAQVSQFHAHSPTNKLTFALPTSGKWFGTFSGCLWGGSFI